MVAPAHGVQSGGTWKFRDDPPSCVFQGSATRRDDGRATLRVWADCRESWGLEASVTLADANRPSRDVPPTPCRREVRLDDGGPPRRITFSITCTTAARPDDRAYTASFGFHADPVGPQPTGLRSEVGYLTCVYELVLVTR